MEHSNERATAAYEPPGLIDLGPLAALTLAEGEHLGKSMGGSDAFVMRGHGGITTTSA
jgi:hypothetical protein